MSPEHSNDPPRADIEAELRILTTEEGGRRTPIFPGYVGQFHFDSSDWDVGHFYPEVARASPGDTIRAELSFVSPHLVFDRIYLGIEIACREKSPNTYGRRNLDAGSGRGGSDRWTLFASSRS